MINTGNPTGASRSISANSCTTVGSARKYTNGTEVGYRAVRWDAGATTATELGNLGTDVVFNAHGTVGVVWNHLEFFVGYDYLRIGPVDLQGTLAGLRLWF